MSDLSYPRPQMPAPIFILDTGSLTARFTTGSGSPTASVSGSAYGWKVFANLYRVNSDGPLGPADPIVSHIWYQDTPTSSVMHFDEMGSNYFFEVTVYPPAVSGWMPTSSFFSFPTI